MGSIIIKNIASLSARFIKWLAIQNRLTTNNRVKNYIDIKNVNYVMCNRANESSQQLLFDFPYTQDVRNHLFSLLQHKLEDNNFQEEILTTSKLDNKISRLIELNSLLEFGLKWPTVFGYNATGKFFDKLCRGGLRKLIATKLRKAKKMLAEMVQVRMKHYLRHLQQRARVYAPSDLPIVNCASQACSKWSYTNLINVFLKKIK